MLHFERGNSIYKSWFIICAIKNVHRIFQRSFPNNPLTKRLIMNRSLHAHNSDYTKFSGSDIKNAFVSGYEQGHNDTVESCYGCSEDKAVEYLEEPENFA